MILYLFSIVLTGKLKKMLFAMPYSPYEQTPIDVQSSLVPYYKSLIWSITALAALAALLYPHFCMTSVPHCCTCLMNTYSIHFWSIFSSKFSFNKLLLFFGYISYKKLTSGNIVSEWFPHMMNYLSYSTWHPKC